MSYAYPPSVAILLAAIDAGQVSPQEAAAAIRQAGGDSYVQIAIIRKWLDSAGGAAVWGAITGTITDQADLVAYISSVVAGLLDFKGNTDASGNPNYPAALKGDAYVISVAGKVGGSGGKVVEVGDMVVASADNAGGTEASVGTSWFVLQANITGITSTGLALMRAASAAAALAVVAPGLEMSGTTLRPTSSAGLSLGDYNQGFNILRARILYSESGPGTTDAAIEQGYGISLGSAGKVGWGTGAGGTANETMDLELSRLAAGVLRFNGGESKPCRTKTADYTVDATPGDHTLAGSHATIPITFTLIAANSAAAWDDVNKIGRILIFKNINTADVTVDATLLGQIFTTSLVNTLVLHTGDAVTLQSNGSTWMVL